MKHTTEYNTPIGFSYTKESALAENTRRRSTYYGVCASGRIVAFMEVMDSGENFIGEYPRFKHICEAYMIPEMRGNGIFDLLLSYVEYHVAETGAPMLGWISNPSIRWCVDSG